MDPAVSRRTLLTGAAAGFGFAFTGSMEAFARPAPRIPGGINGYGPLVDDPAGVLSLPAGFSYVLLAQSGVTQTDDGSNYPHDPDGMGVFAGAAGGSTLITNHEISVDEPTPVPRVLGVIYDPEARGGTSTVAVDASGKRLGSYISLAGTDNNCAGGVTPRGLADLRGDRDRPATVIKRRSATKDHGSCSRSTRSARRPTSMQPSRSRSSAVTPTRPSRSTRRTNRSI